MCSRCLSFHLPDDQATKAMKIKRFILYFIIFNGLLSLAPLIAQNYFSEAGILIPHFWILFSIFSGLTFSIYIIAYWRMSISDRSSGLALLGSITLKLLFCMIMAFVYLSQNSVEAAKFLLSFFYLYIFHTVFEIYCLLRNLRNQNSK